jgi:ABC-2 type transport system permease protein
VIPKDYDATAASGAPTNVAYLSDVARTPSIVRSEVTAAIAHEGAEIQAASFAAAKTGKPFDATLAQARSASAHTPPVTTKTVSIGRRPRTVVMSGFSYTAPSQLVLFVFITSFAASGMIVAVRREGITRRMYGTPTSAATIVFGETLGRFALALFQALYIVGLGALIFGVDFGNALGAVALIGLFVLVATSFAVLGGTLFRTPEQSSAVGPPLGIAMGMLSGCMWPRFVMPPFMQHIGQLFPQSWAMDGFIKLIAGGATITGILPELAVLAAFVVVLLPIATWRLRRALVT